MKKIVEYLPLLTICFLYFGFCNLYQYYSAFNIEIYTYVSTTDILVSFLPTIVIAAVACSTVFLNLVIKNIELLEEQTLEEIASDEKRNQNKTKWWKKNSAKIVIIYWLGTTLLIGCIEFFFHYKRFELSSLHLLVDFILMVLIYIGLSVHGKLATMFDRPVLILFLIIFIGYKLGVYSEDRASELKAGITIYRKDHIQFKYKGVQKSTSDSTLYIGKTATHIFLYQRKDSSTLVFPLSQVDDLIIK